MSPTDLRFGAPAPAGNVIRALERAVAMYPDRIAITDGETSLTYRELGERARGIARGLYDAGVRPGDRVGMLMPNCPDFLPGIWGIQRVGAFTQISSKATAADVEYLLGTIEAKALVHHPKYDDLVATIAPRLPRLELTAHPADLVDRAPDTPVPPLPDDDAIAFAGFTSGTTGRPKAVLLDHARWSYFGVANGLEIGDIRPGEVFLHVAPMTHFTIIFLLPTLIRGGTNVVLEGFDPERWLALIERYDVTACALVPSIIYVLLDTPGAVDRMRSLRTIVYAGSPMSSARLSSGIEQLGPVFAQTYAGTEPGFVTSFSKDDHAAAARDQPKRLSSAGRPLLHVDIAIRDDDGRDVTPGQPGEVWVKSPGSMLRYFDLARNDETIVDGWVRSGDIGVVDGGGYLFIVDRKKDMIISGGMNVFPAQIEDLLATHAAVAACAVIGVPHEKWGEEVRAFVVCQPGVGVSADDLKLLVRDQRGPIWTPKQIHFVDSLPITNNGKVDKKLLRAPFWAGRDRAVA